MSVHHSLTGQPSRLSSLSPVGLPHRTPHGLEKKGLAIEMIVRLPQHHSRSDHAALGNVRQGHDEMCRISPSHKGRAAGPVERDRSLVTWSPLSSPFSSHTVPLCLALPRESGATLLPTSHDGCRDFLDHCSGDVREAAESHRSRACRLSRSYVRLLADRRHLQADQTL